MGHFTSLAKILMHTLCYQINIMSTCNSRDSKIKNEKAYYSLNFSCKLSSNSAVLAATTLGFHTTVSNKYCDKYRQYHCTNRPSSDEVIFLLFTCGTLSSGCNRSISNRSLHPYSGSFHRQRFISL